MSRGKRLDGKLKGEDEILTHEEVLKILSEQARNGSISAATSLERALRAKARDEEESLEDELAKLTG